MERLDSDEDQRTYVRGRGFEQFTENLPKSPNLMIDGFDVLGIGTRGRLIVLMSADRLQKRAIAKSRT